MREVHFVHGETVEAVVPIVIGRLPFQNKSSSSLTFLSMSVRITIYNKPSSLSMRHSVFISRPSDGCCALLQMQRLAPCSHAATRVVLLCAKDAARVAMSLASLPK
jgi:hypothetical protein